MRNNDNKFLGSLIWIWKLALWITKAKSLLNLPKTATKRETANKRAREKRGKVKKTKASLSL